MGWTETNVAPRADAIDFIKGEFRSLDFKAAAYRGGVVYAAVEGQSRPGVVFALVVLIERSTMYGKPSIRYKEMSEDVEPYYYEAPASVLDKLTPTEYPGAIRWREKCRQPAPKLTAGSVVAFNRPIAFRSGLEVDTFYVESVKPWRVRAVAGNSLVGLSRKYINEAINEERAMLRGVAVEAPKAVQVALF